MMWDIQTRKFSSPLPVREKRQADQALKRPIEKSKAAFGKVVAMHPFLAPRRLAAGERHALRTASYLDSSLRRILVGATRICEQPWCRDVLMIKALHPLP